MVNYILNQDFVGTEAFDELPADAGSNDFGESLGIYTYGDVQRAIWSLIEDSNSTSGLGSWDADRVAEIVANAQTYGEDFSPGCGQLVSLVFRHPAHKVLKALYYRYSWICILRVAKTS